MQKNGSLNSKKNPFIMASEKFNDYKNKKREINKNIEKKDIVKYNKIIKKIKDKNSLKSEENLNNINSYNGKPSKIFKKKMLIV